MLTIFLFTLLFKTYHQPIPVNIRYEREYNNAFQFCNSIKNKTDSIAKRYGLSARILLPIVFPECMRYSTLKNHIENTALLTLYANFGKKYADFSISQFQMKPSFVEMLENEIICNKILFKDFYPITLFSKNDQQSVRLERITRLNKIEWQIIYLCSFYKIAEQKFATKHFRSEHDKLYYFATAYNTGFWKNFDEIEKQSKLKTFPSGKINEEVNYCYGEIALNFYENWIK